MESDTLSITQIRKYEDLIENKIKPNLSRELESLKEISTSVEQYEVLRANILLIKKEDNSPIKSLVNIGSEVYAHAKTCERDKIFVNIGLGFHVEFSLDEALSFIEKKLTSLQADLVNKNVDVAKVKQHYYSAIHSLEQLRSFI